MQAKTYHPGSNGRKCTCEPKRQRGRTIADSARGSHSKARARKLEEFEDSPGLLDRVIIHVRAGCGYNATRRVGEFLHYWTIDYKAIGPKDHPAFQVEPLKNSAHEFQRLIKAGIIRFELVFNTEYARTKFSVCYDHGQYAMDEDKRAKDIQDVFCGYEEVLSVGLPPTIGVGGGDKLPPTKRGERVQVKDDISGRNVSVPKQRTYVVVAPSKEPAKGSLDIERQRTSGQFAPNQSENLTKAPNPSKNVFLTDGEKKTARQAEEVRRGLPVK